MSCTWTWIVLFFKIADPYCLWWQAILKEWSENVARFYLADVIINPDSLLISCQSFVLISIVTLIFSSPFLLEFPCILLLQKWTEKSPSEFQKNYSGLFYKPVRQANAIVYSSKQAFNMSRICERMGTKTIFFYVQERREYHLATV